MPFPPSTLKRVLDPSGYRLWERLTQYKELRAAGIANLEFCPLCRAYAIIIEATPDEHDLFRCENVEEGCGKITCRKCKREYHQPRTCREEELKGLDPRHAVEEAMSEALIRRCPGCQTRVFHFPISLSCPLLTSMTPRSCYQRHWSACRRRLSFSVCSSYPCNFSVIVLRAAIPIAQSIFVICAERTSAKNSIVTFIRTYVYDISPTYCKRSTHLHGPA